MTDEKNIIDKKISLDSLIIQLVGFHKKIQIGESHSSNNLIFKLPYVYSNGFGGCDIKYDLKNHKVTYMSFVALKSEKNKDIDPDLSYQKAIDSIYAS